MENTNYCQSCGMPLIESEGLLGTHLDGTAHHEYCIYCFKDGAFVADCTVSEMIKSCIPFMLEAHPNLTREEAHQSLSEFLPTLKRWK